MSTLKVLGSSNSLLERNNKLIKINRVTSPYAGYGSQKAYLVRGGKILANASGLPYKVKALSPVLAENSWRDIQSALDGGDCPWELGMQKNVGVGDVENGGYYLTATLVGKTSVLSGKIVATFALRAPAGTLYGTAKTNQNYYGYYDYSVAEGETEPSWHIVYNPWINNLLDFSNAIQTSPQNEGLSLFGVKSNATLYYDSQIQGIDYVRPVGLGVDLISALDLVSPANCTDYPPAPVTIDGVTYSAYGNEDDTTLLPIYNSQIGLQYLKNAGDAFDNRIAHILGSYALIQTRTMATASGSLSSNWLCVTYQNGHLVATPNQGASVGVFCL